MNSEDEEAAEWEREQISRGTQSRRQFGQSTIQLDKKLKLFDIGDTKKYIQARIERQNNKIEKSRKDIADCKIDVIRTEKKIASHNILINKLQSIQTFFDQIALTTDEETLRNVLNSNQNLIEKLPEDQREFISMLSRKIDDQSTKDESVPIEE